MRKEKDRSEEMLIRRSRGVFGGRSLPCNNVFGPNEGDWRGFFSAMDLGSIIFGAWTKEEVLFLLKNRENAISLKGSSAVIYCPNERRGEIIQILEEEFGKLTVGEMESGQPYIAVDNNKHVLIIDDDGCHLMMHLK